MTADFVAIYEQNSRFWYGHAANVSKGCRMMNCGDSPRRSNGC